MSREYFSNLKFNGNMAVAILECAPQSHPFEDRNITLSEPIKIGRSVARIRPAVGNAIFDCKVLSRNHALLWYEGGKASITFYLHFCLFVCQINLLNYVNLSRQLNLSA